MRVENQAGCVEKSEKPIGLASFSQSHVEAAMSALATSPGILEIDALGALLWRHYGLSGEIEILSSEVEQTAEIRFPTGERLIFKTAREKPAVESFRFQSAALSALEGSKGFVAPTIIRTLDGAAMFEEAGASGYLQSLVEGVPLHREARSPDLLDRCGRALAHLDRALAVHDDLPGARRPVLWHIGCWPRLIELERHLPEGEMGQAVARAMRDYLRRVEPALCDVPWQVTHNDPSPFNTLAAGERIAFIDFGDGGFGPQIQDLAIAASHQVADPASPLGGAEHLIAGYASILPLSKLETTLLVGLMKARQSALILINHWRASLFPGETAYIMKNVARAKTGLAILDRLSPGEGEAAVRAALAASSR
ncbi:Ser/Thr protein kinase RdoA involved in Cpx stress response, MazF antagonist [Fulvimarina manganoxydans]|uniref:Ser/Thr protein kinase RdoA involved in Cpx stress response, MazF antagonist n=1 Tax=Fulvimarina manganoxydans TaxID=937218 RepID=A0A1W2DW68_9HYPH|nr:phosphotransferase [Fulvimarina manganoxydans]SMD01276.1 Ser/Thr protein kinase RdoA involved in Cpx stress response, MazF antagonist [Fulvimarina manganoxydans]